MRGDVTPPVLEAVYRLVGLLPVVCGVLQLAAWSRFDLTSERLRLVSESVGQSIDGSRAPSSESQVHLEENGTMEMAPPTPTEAARHEQCGGGKAAALDRRLRRSDDLEQHQAGLHSTGL